MYFCHPRDFSFRTFNRRKGHPPRRREDKSSERLPGEGYQVLERIPGSLLFLPPLREGFRDAGPPTTSSAEERSGVVMGPAEQAAQKALTDQLTSAPILAHFDDQRRTVIQTDASYDGLGAVLLQETEDGLKPVAYISRRLTDTESRYHSNELECLAIVWALGKLRSYIYGRKFVIQTDNSAVRWLMGKRELTGKFARWVLSLQEYDFEISHIPGVENCVADALSRDPVTENATEGPVVCLLSSRIPLGVASKELALQQRLDGHLKPIIDLIQSKASPDPCGMKKQFVLSNGVLYKKGIPGKSRPFLLCVPSFFRDDILCFSHDDPSSGHMGVEKTLGRVAERYWWPRLGTSVRKFVLSCSFCQSHKHQSGRPAGFLQPIPPPTRPFESLNMDHLGPFKITADGNRHIRL